MWILIALFSALFASITTILSKIGTKDIDSDKATFIRTAVVLVFSWLMVLIKGSINTIGDIDIKSLIFLVLSGIVTGLSWLCYFKALKLGDVNKVAPIDKLSIVLTLVLAIIFFNEEVTIVKIISIILIGTGTYLMIEKKKQNKKLTNNKWLIYAFLSAIFASLTAVLGKIGISDVESNLGVAIRTIVVLIMAFIVVLIKPKQSNEKKITKKNTVFLVLSGIATGASWLCYYYALKEGTTTVVVSIDKLSILFVIIFSGIFLKEKINKKGIIGLIGIVIGTLLLVI